MIKAPFGQAETIVLDGAEATHAVAISNGMTVIDLATNPVTTNTEIDLTIDSALPKGASLLLKVIVDDDETVTFGDGITDQTLAGITPGALHTAFYTFDGTGFVPAATYKQVVPDSNACAILSYGLFVDDNGTLVDVTEASVITTGTTTGTIAVTVANGTTVTALIAVFETSRYIDSIKVATTDQVSGTTANDFTTPVAYVVTAQDETTARTYTVTVTVAPS